MPRIDKTAPLPPPVAPAPPPPIAPPPPPPVAPRALLLPLPSPPTVFRDAENWAKTSIDVLAAQHPACVFTCVICNEHLECALDDINAALIKGRYRKRKDLEALRLQAMSVLEDDVCDLADMVGLTDYRIKTRLIGRRDAPKVEVTIVAREPLEAEMIIDLTDLLDDHFASR